MFRLIVNFFQVFLIIYILSVSVSAEVSLLSEQIANDNITEGSLDFSLYEQIESSHDKDIYKIADKNGGYSYLVCPKTQVSSTEDESSCPADMDADACLAMLNADQAVDEDVNFKNCYIIGSGEKTLIVLSGKDTSGSGTDTVKVDDLIDLSEIKNEIREILNKAIEKQDLAGIFGDESLNSIRQIRPQGNGSVGNQQGNQNKEDSFDISQILQQFIKMQQLNQLLGGNQQGQGGAYPAGIGGGSGGNSGGFQQGAPVGNTGSGCSTCNTTFSSNQGGQGDGKVEDSMSDLDKKKSQSERLTQEIEKAKERGDDEEAIKEKEEDRDKVEEEIEEDEKEKGKDTKKIKKEREEREKRAEEQAKRTDTPRGPPDTSWCLCNGEGELPELPPGADPGRYMVEVVDSTGKNYGVHSYNDAVKFIGGLSSDAFQ